MRFLMEEIHNRFNRFLTSSSETLMVLVCEPEHSALVLKSLEMLEDDPKVPDVFLSFGHPYNDAQSYVTHLVTSLRQQCEQVNVELIKRGDAPLALPSEEPYDSTMSPTVYFLKTLQHMRSVISEGRLVIWIFYPPEIREATSYLDLMNEVRRKLNAPALRGTRVIVRDSLATPILTPVFKDQPKVHVYQPAVDPESLEKQLNAHANSPSVPVEEQTQAHMMLAGLDVANGRFDQALARNLELAEYFKSINQKHQQSIILNNVGDLHYMQQKFSEAQDWYARAIILSVEIQSQPLVLYQSMNLGNALFAQRKFDEALTYYQAAEKLAEASHVPVQRIQALEQIGIVKQQTGHLKEAQENWEKAAELSIQFHHDLGLQANVEHLRQIYTETGNTQRLAHWEKALNQR